jgi:hypothetical protein
MARPTKYTPALLKKAKEYLDKGWEDDLIPSHVGLSLYIGVRRETLYAWAKEAGKEEFSNILDEINAKQQSILLKNGLNNTFNSQITKLVLGKHGYSDKQDVEHSGNPDKPLQTIERVIVDNG